MERYLKRCFFRTFPFNQLTEQLYIRIDNRIIGLRRALALQHIQINNSVVIQIGPYYFIKRDAHVLRYGGNFGKSERYFTPQPPVSSFFAKVKNIHQRICKIIPLGKYIFIASIKSVFILRIIIVFIFLSVNK